MSLLRRSYIKRKPHKDPVTSELRQAVFDRDGQCVLAKLSPSHECRDQWGTPHDPKRLDLLTIEHTKESLRMGRRGPSDLGHCLALCAGANIGVPSKVERELFRAYLAEVAP